MNRDLVRLYSQGHGVFTTAVARRCGVTALDLVRYVKRGEVLHLARGVYALPSDTPLNVEAKHLRLAAGVCRLHPDGVLTHHSALLALELPAWDADLGRVIMARKSSSERIAQHWTTRPRQDWVREISTGVGRCVDPASAIVQHALESGAVGGVVAADSALHDGKVQLADLEALGTLVSGWPNSHHVRTMIALADGRSESVGESRLRVDLSLGGIDVVPQVVIREEGGRFVARVDFMVKGTNVVIEFDGLVKYRDGGAEALVAEKRREDWLRRLGYVVLRFTWADLAHPARVRSQVRAAIADQRGLSRSPSLANLQLRSAI